jgi:hypothetical protein
MKKSILLKIVVVLSLALIAAVAYALTSYISPSTHINPATALYIDLKQVEAGKVQTLDHPRGTIFALRPSAVQWNTIKTLDAHVSTANDKALSNFYAPANMFVYWARDPNRDCPLEHFPAAETLNNVQGDGRRWLGGFAHPTCEISYDYAGRAIANADFSKYGLASNYRSMRRPELKIENNLLVIR